jgi:DNA mismatch endonuclease (patch repair protein)
MDTLTPEARSERMSRIRATNTKPEMTVRRLVHRLGYRYRLHGSDLPGKPDLIFSSRRKVIFVHGCFWHRHSGCELARMPKSRIEFWQAKLAGNKARDRQARRRLTLLGWKSLLIWECEVRDEARLTRRVRSFLQVGEHNA